MKTENAAIGILPKGRIWFYSIVAALGGFLFGFDTIVINGAEKDIQAIWEAGKVGLK